MATVRGGTVLPHVQAFADEAERRFGIDSFGTYPGHQPTPDRAVDCFGTRPEMLALAQWTTQDDVIDRYGIDYTMFDVNQTTVGSEIYNREISRSWRQVPDRGGPTQNHHDHVHVSFEKSAVTPPQPHPQEDDEMALMLSADGKPGVLLRTGGLITGVRDPQSFYAYAAAGVPSVKVSGPEWDAANKLAQ